MCNPWSQNNNDIIIVEIEGCENIVVRPNAVQNNL